MKLPDKILNILLSWFTKRRVMLKWVIVISIILILLLLVRISYFGVQLSEFSKRLIPFNIPIIDTSPKTASLFLNLETKRCIQEEYALLENQEKLASSDFVKVSFGVAEDAYIAVFGVDKNGLFGIYPKLTLSGELVSVEGVNTSGAILYTQEYQLSKTNGEEIIFLLGSKQFFDGLMAKDIISNLDLSAVKGPAGVYDFSLDNDNISVRSISYNVSNMAKNC